VGIEPYGGFKGSQSFFWSTGKCQNKTERSVGDGQVRRHCQRPLGLYQPPLIVAAARQDMSESRVGFSIGAVEFERAARQHLAGIQSLSQIERLIQCEREATSVGKSAIAPGKVRIEIDGLLKEILRLGVVLARGFAEMP